MSGCSAGPCNGECAVLFSKPPLHNKFPTLNPGMGMMGRTVLFDCKIKPPDIYADPRYGRYSAAAAARLGPSKFIIFHVPIDAVLPRAPSVHADTVRSVATGSAVLLCVCITHRVSEAISALPACDCCCCCCCNGAARSVQFLDRVIVIDNQFSK